MFFVIIVVLDFTFGKICDYLRDHAKGGFSGNVHYICEECNEEIIMMGSSRMRHHYVPQVFEDSLGITCYNAGIDGNGIILNFGFLEMILQRYTPKMIIYDVSRFDIFQDDNTKYLGSLRPYYHKNGISEIFKDVDESERWKMLSAMYRYNSNLLGMLGDNLHPMQSFDKGYWPIIKTMNYEPEMPDDVELAGIDNLKISYLHKFITLSKTHNVPVVFIVSPTWFGQTQTRLQDTVLKVCEEEGIPFIDDCYDEKLCGSKEYWSDATHLNDIGARSFSKWIVGIIKLLYR